MAQDLVKSAARALEILEVFAEQRKRLNSAQLGQALGYPKSSLSVLLRSLVKQGYLTNAYRDGEFFPTLKLARLGEWVPAALLGSETLLPTLAMLRDRTGETVTLTMPADLQMRCLHALIGTHPIAFQVEEGVTFPTVGSAIGTMYLATQPETEAERVFGLWRSEAKGRSRDALAELRLRIDAARSDGFATAYDAVVPDTGAVAMPIAAGAGGETLIVAVAGLSRRIQQGERAIIKTMRSLIPG